MSLVDHFWPSVRDNPITTRVHYVNGIRLGGRTLKAQDICSHEEATKLMHARQKAKREGRPMPGRLGKAGGCTWQSAMYVWPRTKAGIAAGAKMPPEPAQAAAPTSRAAVEGDDSSIVDRWF